MDVTELTTAAGWIAGLAILALVAAGWRKPARATPNPARASFQRGDPRRAALVEEKTQWTPHNHWWRRVWAIVAGSVLALWVAAITATVLAFGTAWLVVTLTDMLKQ